MLLNVCTFKLGRAAKNVTEETERFYKSQLLP